VKIDGVRNVVYDFFADGAEQPVKSKFVHVCNFPYVAELR
jgi:hypothetical protein